MNCFSQIAQGDFIKLAANLSSHVGIRITDVVEVKSYLLLLELMTVNNIADCLNVLQERRPTKSSIETNFAVVQQRGPTCFGLQVKLKQLETEIQSSSTH